MLDWLLETALIGALLASVVLLLCRFIRLSPALRHTLWLVVLLKLLTPAGVAWHVPGEWLAWQETTSTNGLLTKSLFRKMGATAGSSSSVFSEESRTAGRASSGTELSQRTADITATLPAPPVYPEANTAEQPENISEEAIIAEMLAAAAAVKSEIKPAGESLSDRVSPTVSVATSPPLPTWREHIASLPGRAWLLASWGIGTLVVILMQLRQLIRWRRLIRSSAPAPEHLTNHVRVMAGHLRIRAPEVRVVDSLPSPVIWCLGRPRLLWPARLLDSEVVSNHDGVIVHELAHVKRRDHWVARLELLATSIWWWNPVWWATRRRLRESADSACDAWVVWALPEDRRAYAESLIELSSLSMKKQSAVAFTLGATDNVCRDFERRLTMIVKSNWPRRVSVLNLALIALVAFLVLPQWMQAEGPSDGAAAEPETVEVSEPRDPVPALAQPAAQVNPAPVAVFADPIVAEAEPAPQEANPIRTPQPIEPLGPSGVSPVTSGDPSLDADLPPIQPLAPSNASPVTASPPRSLKAPSVPQVPSNISAATSWTVTTTQNAAKPRQTILRVFQLKHRKPAEMLQLIQPVWSNLQKAISRSASLPGMQLSSLQRFPKPVATVTSPKEPISEEIPARTPFASTEETPVVMPFLQIDNLRVLADVDSKSIIARGRADMVDFVASLVKAFDVPEGAPIGKIEHPDTQTFNLRTRDAKQILDIANKLGLRPRMIYPSTVIETVPQAVDRPNGYSGVVRFPSGIKTLIVAGTKEELEDIARLIEALDPQPELELRLD